MNVFESKWILVIAAKIFLFRILNKKINIAQKKKKEINFSLSISHFIFPFPAPHSRFRKHPLQEVPFVKLFKILSF